ncbi:MAG: cation transporter [Lachnospiraceae bacterium]|nr:cation transporter [Lachnospiraceae bacterium]
MNPVLSNVMIIAVIVIILILAIKGSIMHFKGEGACCGGGSGDKLKKPKKLGRVIATKTIRIEGMVCNNCRIRIQNALNSIDGINARVNRHKGTATIRLGKDVEEAKIKKDVTDLGYMVNEMKEATKKAR